ncbi:MAG: hypothetical protein M3Z33_07330 [Actinomycetota bacterium]|nr:hypothetical protein [Actinomycetota bacterium]
MHLSLSRIRRRLADEGGFTLVVMFGALTVITLMTIAAIAIAQNDQPLARVDQDKKIAYAAAEAGISDYFFHLNQDNAYWAKCTGPGINNPAWNGVGADPRGKPSVPGSQFRNVPGSAAWYTLEPLPANGFAQCDASNATASMVDASTGTFRIRATGHSRNAKRSVVTTFKRKNFLDFLYFTDYETADPTWYVLDTNNLPTRSGGAPNWSGPDYVSWGSANCPVYWRQNRGALQFNGQVLFGGSWIDFADGCTEIQFAPGDQIRGPFHTNDEILVCGSPTFGRNVQDRIEVSGPGWRSNCGGSNPNFVGTWTPNAPLLTLPPTDDSLSTLATSAYRFTGTTSITLNGANMTVTNSTMGLNNVSMALPSNGVIYVQNGVCGVGYQPLDPYGDPQGCGNVYVNGSYSKDLTIATAKDIIVKDDVTRSGDVMLGLIANNFVRVYHPVVRNDPNNPFNCTNAAGTQQDIQIDAAILSLQHSFTVDNYYCGAALGTLSVNGVIGQKFRGPVGRGGGGAIVNGYTKNYNYDDRMRFRSPPHFLDPVQASWRISRYTEQIPAR